MSDKVKPVSLWTDEEDYNLSHLPLSKIIESIGRAIKKHEERIRRKRASENEVLQ